MLVDSHCHLDCIDLTEFDNSFDKLVQTSFDSGIEHMLCVSINLNDYTAMRDMVHRYDAVSVSVGLHPIADETETFSIAQLTELAKDDKVVAIGETGLDYYYHKDQPLWQQQRFREHLQVANDVDKPVIVHTRDAAADTLKILKEENASGCGGVIHCFTETMEFAEQAMAMGLMISFSGIVTFRNAENLRQVAREVPDELLLIETDSPYLAPVPHRGKQNQPAYVRHVAETIAQIRETSVEEVARLSRDNYYRLFKIKTAA